MNTLHEHDPTRKNEKQDAHRNEGLNDTAHPASEQGGSNIGGASEADNQAEPNPADAPTFEETWDKQQDFQTD